MRSVAASIVVTLIGLACSVCALMLIAWLFETCHDDWEFEWRGAPPGHTACTHAESLDELHCVVDGKPFICIRDWSAHVVECAPGSVMR